MDLTDPDPHNLFLFSEKVEKVLLSLAMHPAYDEISKRDYTCIVADPVFKILYPDLHTARIRTNINISKLF